MTTPFTGPTTLDTISRPTSRWCVLYECVVLLGATSTTRVRLLPIQPIGKVYVMLNRSLYDMLVAEVIRMRGLDSSMKTYGGEYISTRYSACRWSVKGGELSRWLLLATISKACTAWRFQACWDARVSLQ